MKTRVMEEVKKTLIVFAGCLLMAVAFNMIYDPCGIVTGGVSGLGIVLKSVTQNILPGGVPLWLSTILFNIPIYILSLILMGKASVVNAVRGTILMSLALFLVPSVDIVQGDKVLAAVVGGSVGGAGCALVLSTMSSTGGTDMLGMALCRFFRERTVAQVIGILDGIVVILGCAVFGVYATLYAILSVIIFSKVCDIVLTGRRDTKVFYIISDKSEDIAGDILRMNRGVSGIDIRGMYTNEKRSMLMCAVYRQEVVRLKKLICARDPGAFVIITDARDVRGEGFSEDLLGNEG